MTGEIVVIDRRFRGPLDSGHGGYTCGLLAREIPGAATVSLHVPPPLERQLTLELVGDGQILLCDGEVIVAGLVLRYLAQRHRAGRVLVVTRAAPDPERWRRELWLKFGLRFDVLRDGTDFPHRRRAAPTVNVFAQEPRLIASMGLLSRQVFLDELRQAPPYDAVIIDEAHNVAQRGSGTKRLVVLARELARTSSARR